MNGQIIKLAILGIKRVGITLVVLFFIGFLLLSTTISDYTKIKTEKSLPCELVIKEAPLLIIEEIVNIPGVQKVTPVLTVYGSIEIDNHIISASIEGIYNTYLDINKIVGASFPESSTMPYIVLNKKALSLLPFVGEEKDRIMKIITSEVHIITSGTIVSAVCGVIDDNLEVPKAYISIDAAKRIIAKQSISTTYTDIMVKVQNADAELFLTKELGKLGYNVSSITSINSEKSREWVLGEKQTLYAFLLSAGLIFCATALFIKNSEIECIKYCEQYKSLIYIGVTKGQISLIFMYRLIAILAISSCTSYIIALILTNLSITALSIMSICSLLIIILIYPQINVYIESNIMERVRRVE